MRSFGFKRGIPTSSHPPISTVTACPAPCFRSLSAKFLLAKCANVLTPTGREDSSCISRVFRCDVFKISSQRVEADGRLGAGGGGGDVALRLEKGNGVRSTAGRLLQMHMAVKRDRLRSALRQRVCERCKDANYGTTSL